MTEATEAGDDLAFPPEVDARAERRLVLLARTLVIGSIVGLWQGVITFGFVDPFWISSPILIAEELWRSLLSGEWFNDVSPRRCSRR